MMDSCTPTATFSQSKPNCPTNEKVATTILYSLNAYTLHPCSVSTDAIVYTSKLQQQCGRAFYNLPTIVLLITFSIFQQHKGSHNINLPTSICTCEFSHANEVQMRFINVIFPNNNLQKYTKYQLVYVRLNYGSAIKQSIIINGEKLKLGICENYRVFPYIQNALTLKRNIKDNCIVSRDISYVI